MNKQQIKTRIEQLENSKKFEKDLQIDLKAKLDRSVERLIDINDELQELERDLEIEEQKELTTYPSTEQKYGDFTGVDNEDR